MGRRAGDKKEEGFDAAAFFAPSERSGLGYTEDDSAGQSNIFATEPKVYQGKEISNSWVVALVGTIAAGGLVFVGVQKLLVVDEDAAPVSLGSRAPLSQYVAEFQPRRALAPVAVPEAAPALEAA